MERYKPIRQKKGKVANQKERLEWSPRQIVKRKERIKKREVRGKERQETQIEAETVKFRNTGSEKAEVHCV